MNELKEAISIMYNILL